MMQRMNLATVAPDGMTALVRVKAYLKKCANDPKLAGLVENPGLPDQWLRLCLHMHTEAEERASETAVRRICLMPGVRRTSIAARAAALAWAEIVNRHCRQSAPDEVYKAARSQFPIRMCATCGSPSS